MFTMKSRSAILGIDRAYSEQEEIWAKLQNLAERPATYRSA
jgi:hypothetical protein